MGIGVSFRDPPGETEIQSYAANRVTYAARTAAYRADLFIGHDGTAAAIYSDPNGIVRFSGFGRDRASLIATIERDIRHHDGGKP